MFGVNAQYPVSDDFIVTAFVVNSYYHLARPNDLPSYGGRWVWRATPRLTLMQTLYGGRDQTETSLEFWRLYGNHIVEWKGDDVTVAASFDIGTENVAERVGSPRAFVTGGEYRREMAYYRSLVCGGSARVLLGSEWPVDRGRTVCKGYYVHCRVQASISMDEYAYTCRTPLR